MKNAALICLCLFAPLEALGAETTGVIGSTPWDFEPRSREHHLAMQLQGPGSGQVGGFPGQGGISGYPGYPIYSNSYAIGNWIQVDMNLGDGSEGMIMIENHQTNDGNQQSTSDVLGDLIEILQSNGE